MNQKIKQMKKLLFIIIPVLIFFIGCDDVNSFHEDYIKDGEIIYSVKPDSTAAFSGQNRVLIRVGFETAPYISKIKIDWREGAESKTFDVAGENDSVSYEFLIDNLDEESYVFDIYSIDKDGHRSVKVNEFTAAYGDKYIATLQNRSIKSVSSIAFLNSLTIEWQPAKSGLLFSDLSYTNINNELIVVRVIPDEESTIFDDCDLTKEVSYKSAFVPEKLAIDTFYTAPSVIDF